MNNWQERMKEEYVQLRGRYEKLKAHNNRIEVKRCLGPCTEKAEDDYRFNLMREQLSVMGEYLHLLELRAELEGIDLNT